MKLFLRGFGAAVVGGTAVMAFIFLWPRLANHLDKTDTLVFVDAPIYPRQKTKEELIGEAMEKSSAVKALYMTADVANDPGRGAAGLRKNIIRLAEETEINGIVIDTKEVCGPDYNESALKKLLQELREKNIWAIARIVAFKDASQREAHPDWYLTRKNPKPVSEGACVRKQHLVVKNHGYPISHAPLWRDNKGGYWLDPASPDVRDHIIGFAKKMSDLGFNELQFDYVRFPSDGDVSQTKYPAWDGKTPKHEILKGFFAYLQRNLKTYRPELILSADLFGYVANQGEDKTIGQRLVDIAPFFDFVSFMVYPSHYYAGLILPADPERGLPAVNYTFSEARTHPDVVVGRSLLTALTFLKSSAATSSAATSDVDARSTRASTSAAEPPILRPWLEDFFHEQDRLAGRPYGAQKVRMQIDAAEQSGSRGWMLWNASNIYSENALKKE